MADAKPLVRVWRTRLGLTQRIAAEAVGLSKSRFCVYDRGEEAPPVQMRLAMKARALGLEPFSYEDAA